MAFHVDVQAMNGSPIEVRLTGELDSHACAELEQAVDVQLDEPSRSMAVDAGELTFLDSSGLRELLRLRQRVEQSGGTFRFTAVSHQVRRVLEITDLLEEFGVS